MHEKDCILFSNFYFVKMFKSVILQVRKHSLYNHYIIVKLNWYDLPDVLVAIGLITEMKHKGYWKLQSTLELRVNKVRLQIWTK